MVLFAAITAKAQLTDVGSTNNGFAMPMQIGDEWGFGVTNSDKFYFYNAETFEISVELTAPKVDGYEVAYFSLVDRYLINTDYQIEYFVTYTNSSNEYVTYLYTAGVPRVFKTVNSVSKVAINGEWYIYMYSPVNKSTYVYKAEGEGPTPVDEEPVPFTSTSYPNPANDYMTINYDITGQGTAQCMVYNASGKLVEHITIGDAFKQVRIDVSGYKPGVYMYSINGVVNRFVVE